MSNLVDVKAVGDNLILIKVEPVDSDGDTQFSHNSDGASCTEEIAAVEQEGAASDNWYFPSTSGCENVPMVINVDPKLVVEEEMTRNEQFSCFYCHEPWETLPALRSHIKSQHSHLYRRYAVRKRTGEKPCFIGVERQLKNTKLMSRTSRNPVQNQTEVLQCPFCDYSTIRKDSLRLHKIAKHSIEKPFPCPICGHRSTRKVGLRQHFMAKHTGEKMFQCEHCAYSSSSKSLVRQHTIDKHSIEKPFPCAECGYRSARKKDLQLHVMAKHTGERPFHCSFCHYSCVDERNLKRHIISKHSSEILFPCPHCEQGFAWKHHLQRHIMSKHTKERPHACPHCEYTCTLKHNLKKHIMCKHSS